MPADKDGSSCRAWIRSMEIHHAKKIGFDLSPLSDDAAFGVSRYGINLLQALAKLNEFHLCLLYPWSLKVGKAELSALNAEQISFQPRFLGTKSWEQLYMPILAAKAGCSAIHSIANVAPAISRRPVVLTLHDTITYSGQANVSPATMRYLRNFGMRGVRNADAIITVSEFSRKEIAEFFKIDKFNIYVVPNGVGQAFFNVSRRPNRSANGRTILACGSLAPNKNLRITLRVFAQILARVADARLELFSIAPGTEQTVIAMASEAGIPQSALGFVRAPDEAGMSQVFVNSDLLLFPSLNEGFGLPVVEAFAAGVPVVTSNRGALAEVSGDAAITVDPTDPAPLASSAIAILENVELQRDLQERGRRRSSLYTWDRAAATTAEVYRRVLR